MTANFVADEKSALTMPEFENGHRDPAILVGTGIPVNIALITGTWIGYRFGAIVDDPMALGLDFLSPPYLLLCWLVYGKAALSYSPG
jgi:predicted branched-subunit amino acid permease